MSVQRVPLDADGYESMSLAAVAHEARTTRQALYRRWPTKADLAAAAVQDLAEEQDASGRSCNAASTGGCWTPMPTSRSG